MIERVFAYVGALALYLGFCVFAGMFIRGDYRRDPERVRSLRSRCRLYRSRRGRASSRGRSYRMKG